MITPAAHRQGYDDRGLAIFVFALRDRCGGPCTLFFDELFLSLDLKHPGEHTIS
jgi:hypothetical protein